MNDKILTTEAMNVLRDTVDSTRKEMQSAINLLDRAMRYLGSMPTVIRAIEQEAEQDAMRHKSEPQIPFITHDETQAELE